MKGHSQKGFSLIEILVAMALVSIILLIAVGTDFSDRKSLDQILDKYERVIRFSSDEAILKNNFVRMNLNIDKDDGQHLSLEYSDDKNFVIDLELARRENSESESDKELREEKEKEQNSSFSNVPEFEAEDFELPGNVVLLGSGSELTENFITSGKTQIYFYPNGQKDASIIIFATSDELATLEIEPFRRVINRRYIKIPEDFNGEFEEYIVEKANEIFNEWAK
ncbi:MAG: type II secretion system protein [Bdellovibrionota bacterium]|nr:type II secretion system protein [Bdellovibrionota bacterium]